MRATAEMTALQEKTSQQDATLKALTEQNDELKQKKEQIELQLSTSVTQARYLAMESQCSAKQGELLKLNEALTAARQENFTLQASSENNQVKVNNLTE